MSALPSPSLPTGATDLPAPLGKHASEPLSVPILSNSHSLQPP